MVVLDAFALVALALDEPAAEQVEDLLREGATRISAVNLGETIDQLLRVHDDDPEELRRGIDVLIAEVFELVPVGEEIAWRAAQIRKQHYRRRDSQLSLADCMALALLGPGDRIATADPPLARAAWAEGHDVVALPDSSGSRPER